VSSPLEVVARKPAHATGDIGVPTSGSAPLATVDPNVKLETDPEQKKHEHSVLRQILYVLANDVITRVLHGC
jgi:hypothetical protein